MTDVMAPLAYLHGKPTAKGKLKVKPEHFFVSETLSFEPAGQGEHFLVRIRKTGENTKYVANELAKACGVKSRDVSWAGLKDRHAVTEQWFSVHLPGKEDPDLDGFVAQHEGVDAILATTRHDKKLRPGDLIGNQFTLVVSDFNDDDEVESRLEKIKAQGVPNYFGSQRFGRNGNNVVSAREWGQDKFRVRDKSKRSFYLSAARSFLFNQVVSARIDQQHFDMPLTGDLLESREGVTRIVENIDDAVSDMANGHWQITAPMTGDNALPTSDDAQRYEQQIIDKEPDLLKVIRGNRMRHERRVIRLVPDNMRWEQEGDTLTLSFFLPAGCFATAVMREVIVDAEGEQDAHSNQ
ncbi:tRNA pseudouridine(13) synthase TruD [Veronia pacifica]|uniref:tRNA pseudouridine synthase D n=1 Tax=Veronia pacifica TaxID=1080227 RepID=A0A1C3EDR3_9GAMM|nr:tRNA pseudouridine(13) synthase TruD [Veronia pacifica]ODA31350.1 tRNA pseudouridine(13) synthase TruD [Veronia pacifica]